MVVFDALAVDHLPSISQAPHEVNKPLPGLFSVRVLEIHRVSAAIFIEIRTACVATRVAAEPAGEGGAVPASAAEDEAAVARVRVGVVAELAAVTERVSVSAGRGAGNAVGRVDVVVG